MATKLMQILAALALAGCATGGGPRVTQESAGEVALADARAPLVVRVSSRYAGPLAIYSLDAGVATRLGEVPGGRAEEFRIAATQIPARGLTFMAVPVAGDGRASTGLLRVAPGRVVQFDIGASLGEARAAVRSP